MIIGYLSDLHLEFGYFPRFSEEDGGDLLVLGGDILTVNLLKGNRTDKNARLLKEYLTGEFTSTLLQKYSKVIYIMGNHEYYHGYYPNSRYTIHKWFKENLPKIDIDFPVHDHYLMGDCVVWAGTLWSDFENQNPLSMLAAQDGMNDYHKIMDGSDNNILMENISPEHTLREHLACRASLVKTLDEYPGAQFVVCSHHAPSFTSVNKQRYSNNILNGAYATELSPLILQFPNITNWIHGHTHYPCNYKIGECSVRSNPMGYSMEPSFQEFKGTKKITV